MYSFVQTLETIIIFLFIFLHRFRFGLNEDNTHFYCPRYVIKCDGNRYKKSQSDDKHVQQAVVQREELLFDVWAIQQKIPSRVCPPGSEQGHDNRCNATGLRLQTRKFT